MPHLDADRLAAYRAHTFRLTPELHLQTQKEAVDFVNARGFIYFWPIKNILLPSLWTAVAGDRPVADQHDDPGHVTWSWKDQMLDQRRWYYAKVLRGKSTIIALDTIPYFYALSENYGDPEQDYLQLYQDGLLSRPSKVIYEALLQEGPLDTVNLRRKIHMTSKSSNSPFERGLTALQRNFQVLPIGIARTGAWRYSFIYELVHRYYPDLPQQARTISRSTARQKLTALYFDAVGAATAKDVRMLFQWRRSEVEKTLQALIKTQNLQAEYQVEGLDRDLFIATNLIDFCSDGSPPVP
jgi:hypothetical protein